MSRSGRFTCPRTGMCPIYDMIYPLKESDKGKYNTIAGHLGCVLTPQDSQFAIDNHRNCRLYKLLTKDGSDVYGMIKEAAEEEARRDARMKARRMQEEDKYPNGAASLFE